MYSEQVLDHFANPRNTGELPSPAASARLENPACGDVLELWLLAEGGSITAATFKAKGCVSAVACGSALTELICNQTLEAAENLQREALVSALGGLRPESDHASHLAMDVLHAALAKARGAKS